MHRCVLCLVAMATHALVLSDVAAAGPVSTLDDAHRTFFAAHCLACHGPEHAEAGVRLDDLSPAIDTVAMAERWQKVLDVLNAGEMPPPDQPPVDSQAKLALLDDLSRRLAEARKSLADEGRNGALRRLNRREYQNTLRDLFGIEVNVATLPPDTGNGTFDTVGSSLFMSSDQFEQYLAIGREATRLALATWRQGLEPAAEPQRERTEAEVRYRTAVAGLLHNHYLAGYRKGKAWEAADGQRPYTDFGLRDEFNMKFLRNQYERHGPYLAHLLSLPGAESGGYLAVKKNNFHHTVVIGLPPAAPPGQYLLRLRAGTVPDSDPIRHFIEMGINPGSTNDNGAYNLERQAVFHVTSPMNNPQTIEIPVDVVEGSERRWLFREKTSEKGINHQFLVARAENGVGLDPAIWIDWTEWEGPFPSPDRPAKLNALFGHECDDAAVPAVLERIASRALRGGAVDPEFMQQLLALHGYHRSRGQSYTEALVEPVAVLLASPTFLYLTDRQPVGSGSHDPHALTDREVAARLSYFLWSGPPDETLLDAARAGGLRSPAGLAAQARRMIRDPRAFEFSSRFTHQWLGLDRLDFFRFDPQLYYAFDETMREVAKKEVYHTFHHLLTFDEDARCLLSCDFVVVNGLLATYYGLQADDHPVEGDSFRKVALPSGSPRGGLLGMAAVLGMGSNGERTSPVERGAWALRKLLNAPPPPAPANVPQLSRLEEEPMSTRERLRLHQEEPQCAQCHRRIDPIGFGLENFDAAGLWRTEEHEYEFGPLTKNGPMGKVVTATFPIEPAGAFFGGPEFKDYFELRERIADRGDDFLRGLVEHLFAYALGRPVSFADAETIAGLVAAAKADGAGLQGIVVRLVETEEFRLR